MDGEGPESQDRVWELLQRARPLEVRPHFSKQVMEALRHEQERKTGRWAWVGSLWVPVARPAWLAAAAALALTGWWLTHLPTGSGLATTATPAAVLIDPVDELTAQIASELAMIDEVDDLLAPESAQDLGEEDIERLLF